MPLISNIFSNPKHDKLEACLVDDAFHIPQGSRGEHVRKIQIALNRLSEGTGRATIFIALDGMYGPRTADAVLAYKRQRHILGDSQKTVDNIVGRRTIKSLDDEMDVLENELPLTSGLVSTTPFGQEHDHSKCIPNGDYEQEILQGKLNHIGTPINSVGHRRKICIGGKKEVDYLGFEDFVPDPKQDKDMLESLVNGRPFTSQIGTSTVTDISFRSTPLDKFMQREIQRICVFGARLTFCSDLPNVTSLTPYFNRIGVIVESGQVADDPSQPTQKDRQFVVVTITRFSQTSGNS